MEEVHYHLIMIWNGSNQCNNLFIAAFSAELLELAVKAESTPFKNLIEETLRLKDSFTIVRARTLYRKVTFYHTFAFIITQS